MAEYCREEAKDRPELISFINRVFQEKFPEFMEKVYREDQTGNLLHHLVKEDGKIVAALGVYRKNYHLGNCELSTGYLGSVSVSEQARGRGYMKLLMQKAEEEMRDQGVALAMLSGRRNRYGFFGYEAGGMHWKFRFEEENIRLTIGWEPLGSVSFTPVAEEERDTLERIYRLYRQKKVWCRTPQDFYLCCRTWRNRLYEIKQDGNFAGYLLANSDFTYIPEFALEGSSKEQILQMVREIMNRNGKKAITIQVNAWEPEKLLLLQQCCETYHTEPGMNCKILNYPEFFTAMLKLNKECFTNKCFTNKCFTNKCLTNKCFTNKCFTMEEGCRILAVTQDSEGKELGRWKLSVTKEAITVQPSKEKADWILSQKDVVNAFFSPASAFYGALAGKPYLNGWFPFLFTPENVDEF